MVSCAGANNVVHRMDTERSRQCNGQTSNEGNPNGSQECKLEVRKRTVPARGGSGEQETSGEDVLSGSPAACASADGQNQVNRNGLVLSTGQVWGGPGRFRKGSTRHLRGWLLSRW